MRQSLESNLELSVKEIYIIQEMTYFTAKLQTIYLTWWVHKNPSSYQSVEQRRRALRSHAFALCAQTVFVSLRRSSEVGMVICLRAPAGVVYV